MKHAPRFYAEALSDIVSRPLSPEKEKTVFRNFISLLKKNGDLHAAKKILSLTEKKLLKKTGKEKFTIETARHIGGEFEKNIHSALPSSAAIEERINPELIAGIKIVKNDEYELDYSLSRKIEKLFYS